MMVTRPARTLRPVSKTLWKYWLCFDQPTWGQGGGRDGVPGDVWRSERQTQKTLGVQKRNRLMALVVRHATLREHLGIRR